MNIASSMPAAVGSSADLANQHTPQDGEALPLVRQYLRIAHRWRYVVLGAVALSVTLGLVLTLLMTPQYTATSTIEISRDSNQLTNFQGVERETSVADQEFYQTQYGLLRSRVLAERVASQLRLVDDKAFLSALV